MELHEINPSSFDKYDRFEIWKKLVPREIRQLELEFWKRYKKLQMMHNYQGKNEKYVGKFRIIPEYAKLKEESDWHAFINSFYTGEERLKAFKQIFDEAKLSLPQITTLAATKTDISKILYIGITGSSYYGPRRNEKDSDIDIGILIDGRENENNFEIFPDGNMKLHLIGSGSGQSTRYPIHWMLWPQVPLQINSTKDKIQQEYSHILQSTLMNIKSLKQKLESLDQEIKEKRDEIIVG